MQELRHGIGMGAKFLLDRLIKSWYPAYEYVQCSVLQICLPLPWWRFSRNVSSHHHDRSAELISWEKEVWQWQRWQLAMRSLTGGAAVQSVYRLHCRGQKREVLTESGKQGPRGNFVCSETRQRTKTLLTAIARGFTTVLTVLRRVFLFGAVIVADRGHHIIT